MSAEAALRVADPALGRLIDVVIDRAGLQPVPLSTAQSHYEALLRAIVYQQLSGKAAGTIYGRVMALMEGDPLPERLLAVPETALRGAGLSAGKTRYVRALSDAVATGAIDVGPGIDSLDDDAIVRQLTVVPGVGVWSAQMFLIFRLGRPDVLAVGDLGVQKGLQLAHALETVPTPKDVARLGAAWAPHRSLACRYLWKAVDLKLNEALLAGV
ncbi:MAG: DNA-3-methyladenine glycosylase 2 family protein [Myxococcales bacterium]|nr:DNA-3-methyladenine glycosylase 2 family protein [Myxococcales bacterium]